MNNNNKQNSEITVMDYILTKVPTILPDQTIRQALSLVRSKNNWNTINYIYVLDTGGHLVGVVSIKELLRAKDTTVIKKIMTKDPIGVTDSASQQRASAQAIKCNIKAIPILKTGTKIFLGVIGTDKILHTLHKERVEEFLRFSGIAKQHPIVDISKAKTLKLVKLRLPWLLIGLIGGMLGAFLISRFELTLKKEIATAFFIPVVVYISNAVSTQTQALLIRLLSSQKVKGLLFLKKEINVSFILAVVSALTISAFSWFWLGAPLIAMAVFLAIILSTLSAVLIAIAIPSILYTFKKDPALGSGPFATAIQDVLSILIYLLVTTWIIF